MAWFTRKKKEGQVQADSSAEASLQREIATRIDQIVDQAKAAGGGEAYGRLWAAVVELPTWYFVGSPSTPDRPYRDTVNGEPAVFAFTDDFNARKFAVKEKLQRADGSIALLPFPIERAIDILIEAHESDGVPRVVFNVESNYFVGFLKDFRMLNEKRQELESSRRAAKAFSGAGIDDAFTRLAGDAMSTGSGEAVNRLWKAVYELDHWHFINQFPPDGSKPEGPPPFGWPRPMTARVDGKLYVMAFTSPERASASARLNNQVHPQFGIPLLEIPRDGAAEMLCKLDDGRIDGVLFNHNEGVHGFYAPLSSVASMFEWHLDRLPAKMFGSFVKDVTASNTAQAWARLNRRLTLIEQWFFIGDQDRPKSPRLHEHQGEIFALVFTDKERAARGGGVVGGADSEGCLPLIPATPAGAVGFFKTIREKSGGKIQSALFNLGSCPFVETIDELDRLVAFGK